MNDFKKVTDPEDELVWCDHKECVERGQYIFCYFDTHQNCERYKKYVNDILDEE